MSDEKVIATKLGDTPQGTFYRVPAEVIKAWDRGEYFTGGVPSLSYKYLGTALRLRGLYTYKREGNTGNDFKGIAKIELAGGRELVMEGIRLWGDKDKPDIKFWRTEFSHFLSDDKIIWTYRIFDCHCDELLLPHISLDSLPDIKDADQKCNFKFSVDQWQKLQQFLLGEKMDQMLMEAEARCSESTITKVMLHFEVPNFQVGQDLPIKAQYRQLRSGGADITGDSRFDRIT
jgi:hypothetical protein